jgi:tRNA(Ile)-lysidine synthase TilS/MesJ
MRRGYLYKTAQELGCNKIALGHHFDDVIETILMGMLYGSQVQTMMPKIHSENYPGMQLIRPLYPVREADIIHWKQYHDLQFIQCACRFTESVSSSGDGIGESKRQEVKALIRSLRRNNPDIEKCIFSSSHSVCLDTMVGWKTGGETHSFLERFHV